tara:strand:- start:238 stop:1122 length:885 start_codon:yes stop_codon:yes gene_type:complete
MIRINKITRGRFGNKVFQYNNLVQLANNLNVEASCVPWEGNEYFKNIVPFKKSNKESKILYWNDILDNDFDTIKNILETTDLSLDDPSYALHNTFYKLSKKDPREFLELKDKYIPKLDDNYTYVGIHIRGGDILGGDSQDGREIHTPNYYKNSIEHILKKKSDKPYKFIVCTDDMKFESFKETIEYLKQHNLNYELGPDTGSLKYINDFAILCYCDILINSSSTFCCAAIFIGKENKIVIHNKDWMDRIVTGDFSNQEYKKYVKKWTHKMSDEEWLKTRKPREYWINLKYDIIL